MYKDMPPMPAKAVELVKEYEELRELGASRTVCMIGEVLTIVAADEGLSTTAEILEAVETAAQYFRQTRGKITPAVHYLLNAVLRGDDSMKALSPSALRQLLADRTGDFSRESGENTARIARYGANLLTDGMCVLAYDYSGTVMGALKQAAGDGKSLRIIVPESRTLDGGRPIAEKALEWGHRIHFIADAVIACFLPQAAMVLEGVETLYASGDFLGTPGTFNVALLASHFRVPFYALTELTKLAPGSLHGLIETVPNRWLGPVFDHPRSFSKPDSVSVESPGLERIPSQYVTGYITERGILPPAAIAPHAIAVIDRNS